MSYEFFTDANAMGLINRSVNVPPYDYFSSTFYPIDASITMTDLARDRAFTVWNDRPQAGTVHDDGSLKLLIERRLTLSNHWDVPEPMYGNPHQPDHSFKINFTLMSYQVSDLGPKIAVKEHSMQFFSSVNFSETDERDNRAAFYIKTKQELVSELEHLQVTQVSFT